MDKRTKLENDIANVLNDSEMSNLTTGGCKKLAKEIMDKVFKEPEPQPANA